MSTPGPDEVLALALRLGLIGEGPHDARSTEEAARRLSPAVRALLEALAEALADPSQTPPAVWLERVREARGGAAVEPSTGFWGAVEERLAAGADPDTRARDTVSLDAPPPVDAVAPRGPLGPYPVLGVLGAGGMGQVLEVEDAALGRRLAAKIILGRPDPARRLRFVQEARLTGMLEHPNIPPVHVLGRTAAGEPYYTMKRVDGRSLAEVLGGDEAPDRLTLLQVFGKVCDAVAFAHSRGVLHRDLKPGNIMLGEFGEVLVLDWGLARLLVRPEAPGSTGPSAAAARQDEAPRTVAGSRIGTPGYMAPEQARGEVDRIDGRADVFSLGAILYRILAGSSPFRGRTVDAVLAATCDGPPEPPSVRAPEAAVPWELDALVLKALALSPADRYPTVAAMRADVQSILEGRVLGGLSYHLHQRAWKWVRRHTALSVVAAGLVLAVAIGVGVTIRKNVALQVQASALIRREREARDAHAAALRESRRADARARDARVHETAYLRLWDLERVEQLERELDGRLRLDPPTDRQRRRLLASIERDWLPTAEALAARRPLVEAFLVSLERELASQPTRELRWQVKAFRGLRSRLAALSPTAEAPRREAIGVLRWYRSHYRALGQRPPAEAVAWRAAIAAIADPARCPAYGGLRIRPQLGLLPAGRDAVTGLWEFAVIGSGRVPARDAAGRLRVAADTAIVLVLLPGGTFRMGAERPRPGQPARPDVDPWCNEDDCQPVHEVRLRPFFMARTELTRAQWLWLAGREASRYGTGALPDAGRHPAEGVDWWMCQLELARAGLRLPTEAQWEYAARGGTRSVWWTGSSLASLRGAANLRDGAVRAIAPAAPPLDWNDGQPFHAVVASGRPNPFGLYDVHGNVWEWCRDTYHERAYALALGPRLDGSRRLPPRAARSPSRVIRGGGHTSEPSEARSARRELAVATHRSPTVGVRPMRPLID